MKKYLITYNLKTQNWNYNGFFNALKSLGPWWHYIDSTWIIKTSLSSDQIYNRIAPGLLSTQDRILIVEIDSKNKYGYLPKDAWDWLNN